MTSPTDSTPEAGSPRSASRSVPPGRVLAAVVLFLVAVTGGLTAVALDRFVFRPGPHGPPPFRGGPGGHRFEDGERVSREWLARELGLSPEQRVRIDSLMDRQLRQIRAVREQVEPRLDSIVASTRHQIDSVLTPAQREKAGSLARRRFGGRDRFDPHGRWPGPPDMGPPPPDQPPGPPR
jgi:Spy/CpxP family protein refolding chaperone